LRAARFGIKAPEVDDGEKKLAERAKKFSTDTKEDKKETAVKGLDSALPERRPKRGREDRGGGQGGRNAKRQTPDRRIAPTAKPAAAAAKKAGRVVDDPAEKAKAEARAKRFQPSA
jgi:SAP domain-containing ribonucleoprotein